MTQLDDTDRPTDAEVAYRIAFADAALALAGHEITDSWSRELLERHARHEITGDEARAAILKHFQG
ncbi:hypothetical protein [Leifsonia shinshuensis]